MSEYIEKLQKDLRTKLERLRWMLEQPALHVSERFTELRSEIDCDAERLLVSEKSIMKPEEINSMRSEMIRFLENIEEATIARTSPASSNEALASLERRIGQLHESPGGLTGVKGAYVELASEMNEEARRLEERIIGRRMVFYFNSTESKQLGVLVYMGEEFIGRQELEFLKQTGFNYNAEELREFLLKSFNKTLLVPTFKHFKLTKNHLILKALSSQLYGKRATGFLYYNGSNQRSNNALNSASHMDDSRDVIETLFSKNCCLSFTNRRPLRLNAQLLDPFIDQVSSLDLTGVHFEAFDTDLLAGCVQLTNLRCLVTFAGRVAFDLNFLEALTKLKTLELALPHTPSDLSVFERLPELTSLTLEGSSYFAAEKLPYLSRTAIKQILLAPRLQTLSLSYFDIEVIDREALDGCTSLSTLRLMRNRVGRFDEVALKANLQCLTLEQNEMADLEVCVFFIRRIDRLSLVGVGIRSLPFRSAYAEKNRAEKDDFYDNLLKGMNKLNNKLLRLNDKINITPIDQETNRITWLDLSRNSITEIRRDTLASLRELTMLKLCDNPIERIETDAIEGLRKLRCLNLSGCRLKSIDALMFKGFRSLKDLILSDNRIVRIEVVAEDGRRINVAKAELNDEEKELVEKQMFKETASCLSKINLSRNRLEALNLHCFVNLLCLEWLDLSSNRIREFGRGPTHQYARHITLNLSDNQLSRIDKYALPESTCSLDLSRNRLETLDDDVFARLKDLKILNLADNDLTISSSEATFAGCQVSGLDEIDLSRNRFVQLSDKLLEQMRFLRRFEWDCVEPSPYQLGQLTSFRIKKPTRLGSRPIRILKRSSKWTSGADAFGELDMTRLKAGFRLKHLEISGQLIETLDDPDLFTDTRRLVSINLSQNRLTRIHQDIFKCLVYLETVDLSANKLASVDLGLFRNSTAGFRQIDLSSNNLTFLDVPLLLRQCPSLDSLNLADNQLDDRSIEEQQDSIVEDRSSIGIAKLILANNKLTKIDFVRDLTSMRHLNLSGNQIKSVMSINGENLLGRLKRLNHLDLSSNCIRTLRDEMFAHLQHQLVDFNINGNPLYFELDSVLSELI